MLSITIPKNGLSSARLPIEQSLARQLWNVQGTTSTKEFAPRADVLENKDHIVVRLDMPGLSAEDIDVKLDKDVLTIKAERTAPKDTEGEIFHHRELVYGTFTRSFTLPSLVRRDEIDASYANGILSVTMPKVEEAKPKSIKVKEG